MNCDLYKIGERGGESLYACKRRWCWMKPASIHPAEMIVSRCLGIPRWHEFGGWLEIALGVFGIHKRRFLWFKRLVGLQPQCGCQQRAEQLNHVGRWLAIQGRKVIQVVQLLFHRTEKH